MQIDHRQKIATFDTETKEENGYIIPLFKDGIKTLAYLNILYPKAFKGYHVHTEQTNKIYCLAGEVAIYTQTDEGITVTPLSANSQDCVEIPIQTPTALENLGMGNCVLIFYPDPPFNPANTGETIKLSKGDVEK